MRNFFRQANNTKKGFTLVEMVMYVAIFAILSTLVLSILFQIFRNFGEFKMTRDINSTGLVVMDTLVREIRNSYAINHADSSFGANPGKLGLTGKDPFGADRTVILEVVNGRLQITENSVNLGFIGSQNVEISLLVFDLITTPNTDAVRMRMDLRATNGSFEKIKTFNTTSILRGTY